MSAIPEIETERLKLRAWRDADLAPFAALNSDPSVMEHLPSLLSPAESDAFAGRIRAHFSQHRFGLWAVELRATGAFAGFVGLSIPRFEAHFTPCVEIGWRLAREHWGRGLASEGALASLDFGFAELGLEETVSFTVPQNRRSIGVMRKLGMHHSPDEDFDHPGLPPGHRLKRHVLYRLSRIRETRRSRAEPPTHSSG
jgi:RimJ/RimL family protein N-acetyltransferase